MNILHGAIISASPHPDTPWPPRLVQKPAPPRLTGSRAFAARCFSHSPKRTICTNKATLSFPYLADAPTGHQPPVRFFATFTLCKNAGFLHKNARAIRPRTSPPRRGCERNPGRFVFRPTAHCNNRLSPAFPLACIRVHSRPNVFHTITSSNTMHSTHFTCLILPKTVIVE